MVKKKSKWIGVAWIAILFLVAYGCQSEKQGDSNQQTAAGEHPIVTMEMESGENIEIELYPEVAPNTVNNFIFLIEDGFYDGLIFHRVIPDFMIQGGDPEGSGLGGPDYAIKGEFASNGFDNDLKHEPGVLSMARSQDPDSAGSQFFIVTGDADHLDGDYAAFGKVVDGMEVVEEIVTVESDEQDKPLEDQIITSMTVDVADYVVEDPEILEK